MANKREVPATSAVTLERAEAEQTAGNTSFSNQDFITRCGTISSLLCVGKNNAIPGHRIMAALGLKDSRDVTALVERERAAHIPICATTSADCPGYYLPETPSELAAYNKSLSRRVANVKRTLAAMEDTLDAWTGQMRLDLPDMKEAD